MGRDPAGFSSDEREQAPEESKAAPAKPEAVVFKKSLREVSGRRFIARSSCVSADCTPQPPADVSKKEAAPIEGRLCLRNAASGSIRYTET
jgi:hypothetical protein